jgi:hypothetical protein
MCCGEIEALGWPAEVIEALARYRGMLDERGWDWGDDRIDIFRCIRFSQFGPVVEAFLQTGDWAKAVRSVVGDPPPPGFVLVRIDPDGRLRAEVGPPRIAIAGGTKRIDVVVDSAAATDVLLSVDGRQLSVPAHGAAVDGIDVGGPFTVEGGTETVRVEDAVRVSAGARLRLSSPRCSRWSVTDASGGAWFPEGVLEKYDYHHRPFFHGHDVELDVPAEPLHVTCTRGLEYGVSEVDVQPAGGETLLVEADPARLFDPAAGGWYGGDLHIHMNYSGDLVCTPTDAARMQLGEGLHLANLLAANARTSLIYDRAMLEQFPGADLPWSTVDAVARMGVEYRNDLLGHVHALGLSAPPSRYCTGHERSDHPEDWPPNARACEELRGLGATIGYCHPAQTDFPDGSTDAFFANPRSVEARELVVDAALGLVDSIDVISPFTHEGAIYLYHRLLSCGLRLAATAGTDVFLSFSHLGVASNPPGWGRVYAYLGEAPLTVAAFQDAVRSCRTVVTNGPWLTLEVDGEGPGAVLDRSPGDRLDVRARVAGPGVEDLMLVGPDGVIAQGDPAEELAYSLTLDSGPLWIAAIARGPEHPRTLDYEVLAHTSPVYVDSAGRRVARTADAQWCLDLLDGFERLVTEHGHFDPATRDAHLGDVLAVIEEARAFYRRLTGD